MKKILFMLVVELLIQQVTQAQGTLYLSNLGQSSTGSESVGSNLWYAALVETGNNTGGYALDSIELGMVDASGNPNGFTALLYSAIVSADIYPGSNLATLNGSLDPSTAGIYTYTPTSNLTLSPSTLYYIVLTAGTAVANGAYDWSLADANSYNPSGGWRGVDGVWTSINGSNWNPIIATISPQFAITATPIPEPGILSLFGLGGLGLLWQRRKGKARR